MKKTLYSLMLNEEVVREIDRMAHRMGTNRSALINQILADYTSVMTPERRIESIFHEIEQLVAPARDLVPFFAPHTTSMSLKSSLEYKYRPTVKYEVALYGDKQEGLGELAVIFRTQSAALLQSMTQFSASGSRSRTRTCPVLRRSMPCTTGSSCARSRCRRITTTRARRSPARSRTMCSCSTGS